MASLDRMTRRRLPSPWWSRLVAVACIVLPLGALTFLLVTLHHATQALEGRLTP